MRAAVISIIVSLAILLLFFGSFEDAKEDNGTGVVRGRTGAELPAKIEGDEESYGALQRPSATLEKPVARVEDARKNVTPTRRPQERRPQTESRPKPGNQPPRERLAKRDAAPAPMPAMISQREDQGESGSPEQGSAEKTVPADWPGTSEVAQKVVVPPSPQRRMPSSPPSDSHPPDALSAAPQPSSVTLPAGTVIEVRTTHRISSRDNTAGDEFDATLAENLFAEGVLVFRRGTEVRGRLLEVQRPGRVKGRGSVTFELREIQGSDGRYAVKTNAINVESESTRGKDAAKVGAAAAIGTVLGAVFGGKKGAAVGGATAAGAGTTGVLLSRGEDVEIPAERLFSFRLEEELTLEIR